MICLSATSDDIRGVSFKCGHREIDKYFEEKLLTDSDAVSYCFWADADSNGGRKWKKEVRPMEYVTERVVNIAELEGMILSAYHNISQLRAEMEKENPSMVQIDELSKKIHLELLQAKDFEFCIERRKTILTD